MSGAQRTWPDPSPAVGALIREACETLLAAPDEWFALVDEAVMAGGSGELLSDPALAAEVRASNRANLTHWARANVERPGAPVAPNVGPETLDIARDVVRRGLEDNQLSTYRHGQNVAWRHWMTAAFAMTDDPALLHELLDVTARSIFAFVDDTVAGVQQQIVRERDDLLHGAHADLLATVNLLLQGGPIATERASARLRYELARTHTAAIFWTERDTAELEHEAIETGRRAGASARFTIAPSARALWAWFAGAPDVRAAVAPPPDVHVAIGSARAGVEGFRRSHLEALATQRLMPDAIAVASFEDVQAVELAGGDPEKAAEFVARVLGPLASADDALRQTLRAYLRAGSNVTASAKALYAHRNTVLNRLRRAEELLPRPLDQHRLDVALALEIAHWRT